MSAFLDRIFSRRVRELERELDRVRSDLAAMNDGEFEKLSITQMTFTPETGLQCQFSENNVARIIAAWAFNTLEVCDAKNYVEFRVRHPEAVSILITVQRVFGETPGAKASRLEAQLAALTKAEPTP